MRDFFSALFQTGFQFAMFVLSALAVGVVGLLIIVTLPVWIVPAVIWHWLRG